MLDHHELHPIFRQPSCQLVFAGQATFVNSSFVRTEYTMIIGTPGVFLYSKARLRKPKLEHFISIIEIKEVFVFPTGCSIGTKTEAFLFENADHFTIAAVVIALRERLIDPSVSKLITRTEELVYSNLAARKFTYFPESLFSDRFLAVFVHRIFADPRIPYEEGHLGTILAHLRTVKTSLELIPEMEFRPFFDCLVNALTLGVEITELKLKAIPFTGMMHLLGHLVSREYRLTRLIFSEVRFVGDIKPYDQALDDHSPIIKNWVFEGCHACSNEFSTFFNTFLKYRGRITGFEIDGCHFTLDTFQVVTNAFFFGDCFHSLQSLSLNAVAFREEVTAFVQQFVRSDWSLKTRTLKTLCLENTCLDLSILLGGLQMNTTGITNALFSGNVFLAPVIPKFASLLSPDLRLDVSTCGFLDSHLFDFFSALAGHPGRSLDLSVAAAALSEENWEAFVVQIDQLILPTLTSLTWDLNPITPGVLTFFSRQPSLHKLSISDCIKTSAIESLLEAFIAIVPQLRLQRLVWRSQFHDTKMRGALVDIVLGLFQGELRSVDMSGQEIEFEGMLRVLRNMPADMERLEFDGSRLSDGQRLTKLLWQILETPVRQVGWPENDVREALISSTDAPALQAELKLVKSEFEKRATGTEDTGDLRSGEVRLEPQQKVHAFAGETRESSNQFRVVRPENEEFLAEFLGVPRDPLDLLYGRVQQATSVEALRKDLGL
jgi:hypothetical protein